METLECQCIFVQWSFEILIDFRFLAWGLFLNPLPHRFFKPCQANLLAMSLRVVHIVGCAKEWIASKTCSRYADNAARKGTLVETLF